ncbi:MAG: hypothetical protein HFJ50_07465 [Clostridia bacterium]|jgi:hypothetical protein|nr:hypothetical protein [Clostridia bacterium]
MKRRTFIFTAILLVLFVARSVSAITLEKEVTYEEPRVYISQVNSLDIDEIDPNYTSQTCEIITEGCKVESFVITNKEECGVNYFIVNPETGKRQEEFNNGETKFKVMIPNSEVEEHFLFFISVQINYSYDTEEGHMENSVSASIGVENCLSDLSIGFKNKDNDRNIYGCIIEIEGNSYEIYQECQTIMYNLAKGKIKARVVSVPEEYILPENEFEIDIGYKDNHSEIIKLERKKGGIKLTTSNAKSATYEIINSDFQIVRKL